jgi:hypothetical protein
LQYLAILDKFCGVIDVLFDFLNLHFEVEAKLSICFLTMIIRFFNIFVEDMMSVLQRTELLEHLLNSLVPLAIIIAGVEGKRLHKVKQVFVEFEANEVLDH